MIFRDSVSVSVETQIYGFGHSLIFGVAFRPLFNDQVKVDLRSHKAGQQARLFFRISAINRDTKTRRTNLGGAIRPLLLLKSQLTSGHSAALKHVVLHTYSLSNQ